MVTENSLIDFTHANTHKVVTVAEALLAGYYYSESHKATLLLFSGGAMLPVKESPEEIKEKLLLTQPKDKVNE